MFNIDEIISMLGGGDGEIRPRRATPFDAPPDDVSIGIPNFAPFNPPPENVTPVNSNPVPINPEPSAPSFLPTPTPGPNPHPMPGISMSPPPPTSFNPQMSVSNPVPGLSPSSSFRQPAPQSATPPSTGSIRAYRPQLKTRNDSFNRGFGRVPGYTNPVPSGDLRLGGFSDTGGTVDPVEAERRRRRSGATLGAFGSGFGGGFGSY